MKNNRRKSDVREVAVSRPMVSVNVGEVLVEVGAEFRELLCRGGMAIAAALLEDEVTQLCGPRYARGEELASRWGMARGEVVLGGRRAKLSRPRVRRDGAEVELETYRALQREDPLTARAVEQMLIGVSTRKYKRSLEPVIPELAELGTSRSAVSRRFVALTRAQLEAALSRPLGDTHWVALLIDGIVFHEHVVLITLGIDDTGAKHVLGFREGTTENATVCREMLSDLISRGVRADQSILIGIDGGKGLRKAVTQVFGQYALVQRCQVHKKRNVLEHLPEELKGQVRAVMGQAYACTDYATAKKQLANLARSLAEKAPSAASSLNEGLEETLTVKKLGITGSLARTLETTNPIENLNNGIRRVSGRVKRCRSGSMALRWVAASALEASRGFRRLKGHKSIPRLVAALRAHDETINVDNIKVA
jgi:transposase-like protein